MHFVSALDRSPKMRCVLGLFEGVVTGAADGYYRMSERPAATLLHLGPGLANGLANLHNAKKARSGVVNVIGEHATTHLALNAPLTSDIEGLARPMSHWVHSIANVKAIAQDGREAVTQAAGRPGKISSLILPANMAWSECTAQPSQGPVKTPAPIAPDDSAISTAAKILSAHGPRTLLLLGGRSTQATATQWAGRLAAATGCTVMSEFYTERLQRGAGRVAIPRVPYSVQAAVQTLSRFEHIVLVQASEPVAFFGYPDKPGRLAAPGTKFYPLVSHEQDAAQVLHSLCDALGASHVTPVCSSPPPDTGPLDNAVLSADSIALVLTRNLPEQAIVVDEAISTGRAFDQATQQAAPHDWLTNMGDSIGFGLPVAVGAAIAAPERRVIALEGDGSAMYTVQSLWTMARENLNVTVIVFANRSYQILRGEFAQVGAGAPGQRANDMLTIDRPALDWQALARGHGLPSWRTNTVQEFERAMRASTSIAGPSLIEVVL